MRRFALLLAISVLPLAARQETAVCGSTRETGREARFLHRQALRSRARLRPRAAPAPSANRDAGEIAIIEDSDGVVSRQNQFNLDQNTILFAPDSAGASSYRYSVTALGYDRAAASQGVPLTGLGDDDTRAVDLPFLFPFFGATYQRVYVNSDGNLTFTAGDAASTLRSLGRATAGPPRIAPLFDDLDHSQAPGGLRVWLETGRVVVSWASVPEWRASGTGPPQTFQVRLYADGRIEFSYSGAAPANAVVGIAPGALKGVTSLVDFRSDPSADYASAIAERFSDSLSVDVLSVAQKFYETHDDAYDYLAIYNAMDIPAMSGAVAYETTVRSSGSGYGAGAVDDGLEYGSDSRLQAVLNMGPLGQYPLDANGLVLARAQAGDTPLTLLGHETGHLFLAYASVRDAALPDARPMLNTDLQHWSFVFNSEASLLEGERIEDRGAGASPEFLTSATVEGYSVLDQYLMGFAPAADTAPTFLVTGAPAYLLPAHPQRGVGFDGTRRDVAIDEIVAAEGRRTPDDTVAQRRFRFAFILVVPAGSVPSPEQLAQLDNYRRQFESFFARAASNRASADTSLKRSLKLSVFPAAGVLAGGSSTATLTVPAPLSSDLEIALSAPAGFAAVPVAVTIRAGSATAAFTVTGLAAGVEEMTATPAAGAPYETAFSRIQVASASMLKLETVSANWEDPVIVRLTDANRLPYTGARILATPSADGTAVPAVAVTDARGLAIFQWTPGPQTAATLRLALESMPAVSLTLAADGTRPVITEIVNSASWMAGIAPGGFATLMGSKLSGGQTAAAAPPWPASLGGVALVLNGAPLPLLYVSDRQINFYLPPDTPTGQASLSTVNASGARATAGVTVEPTAPGIFTGGVLQAGTGVSAAAWPVAAGDYLEIYCTGLGAAASSGTTVWIGGIATRPSYTGITPGIPGLYQVNVQVPAGLAPGTREVVLSVDLARSNPVPIEVR